jgi:hypothetical protein
VASAAVAVAVAVDSVEGEDAAGVAEASAVVAAADAEVVAAAVVVAAEGVERDFNVCRRGHSCAF